MARSWGRFRWKVRDEKRARVRLRSVKKQPLLTRFPSTVLATSKRRLQAALAASRRSLIGRSICAYAVLFGTVLAPEFLTRIDPTKRQRSFGHLPVFLGMARPGS